MSGASRSLQPAQRPLFAGEATQTTPDNSSTSPGPNRSHGSSRQKRTLIESACSACRRRKSRCDGVRPACSRCTNLRTDCHYEAEEGESRWTALRRRNQVLESERDVLRDILSLQQTLPEMGAMAVFRHVRMTALEELPSLLQHIREGKLPMPPPQSNGIGHSNSHNMDQRLPPIHSILDVSPRNGPMPISLPQGQSVSSEDSRTPSSVGDYSGSNPSSHSLPCTLEPSLQLPPPPKLSTELSGSMGSMKVLT